MTTADFERFFRRYYRERILELARGYPEEGRALTVEWDDLYQFDPDLADDLRANPNRVLADAREALRTFDVPVDVDLDQAEVYVAGFPSITRIRDIRAEHVNTLVSVRGLIRKATPVRPKVEVAVYECLTCGGQIEVVQRGQDLREPNRCHHCERNTQLDRLDDRSKFVDSQRIRIQESPEGLRGGDTPQNIDVHLETDLTGIVSPGDRVTATGILRLREQRQGNTTSPILDVFLEGNFIQIEEQEFEVMSIEDEDIEEIRELAGKEDIYERVVDSIAPSIWGYDDEKLAMALQLFSGVRKPLPDGSRVRGDIHVLLVGDPGTGKSQLLQYITKISPRSVYTSGKGSSAAGLCVTGGTRIHTDKGFRPIEEIVAEELPEPVDTETPASAKTRVYTYDRVAGCLRPQETSRVWRMPEKPCRRIETAKGKSIEASVNTPVLTLGDSGLEWQPVTNIEPGDPVAVPRYFGVERSTPPVHHFIELTNEKLKLSDTSIAYLRHRLTDKFGSLRAAATSLGLTEDDLYTTLPKRHIPKEKLDCILDAVDLEVEDIEIERAMVRHGSSVRLPDEFDEDLMYLIGLVFGDGEVAVSPRDGNHGLVRLSNSNEAVLQRARGIIKEQFDVEVDIEYQKGRIPSIRLYSVTIARWFRNLGIESPKTELELDYRLTTADHTDAFLRGLFDADGSVVVRDTGGSSIQLSTISRNLAEQVQLILETYGIRSRLRTREPAESATLEDGFVIEGNSLHHEILIYGQYIDAFERHIGFEIESKVKALSRIAHTVKRRGEVLPFSEPLARTDGGTTGSFHNTLVQGNDPTMETARRLLEEGNLDDLEPAVREVVSDGITWDKVVVAEDIGEREVFDLTVPTSHNFVGNGIITHNTAAAVRDDFGDGQQWTLEAGALVLADQGIAAVDELDKMRSEDRSAMHEALEQQSVSVSKAGINATLQARCALLGAANPKYGRFDQYEPIPEQIELEPALISRFDLIFTVDDLPDQDRDQRIAEHILQTNYAGELESRRLMSPSEGGLVQKVEEATEQVMPAIEPKLLRKYVGYATQSCIPTMTMEARETIKTFYLELREQGVDEDSPVPMTARKLEALVRLAEASARIRLADEVTEEDAQRVIELVRASMGDIGFDPETGTYDVDMIETGTPKTQRDRIKSLKKLMEVLEEEHDDGIPLDVLIEEAEERGMDADRIEHELSKMKQSGEIYEPSSNRFRLA